MFDFLATIWVGLYTVSRLSKVHYMITEDQILCFQNWAHVGKTGCMNWEVRLPLFFQLFLTHQKGIATSITQSCTIL